jgi:hypothetical protein
MQHHRKTQGPAAFLKKAGRNRRSREIISEPAIEKQRRGLYNEWASHASPIENET